MPTTKTTVACWWRKQMGWKSICSESTVECEYLFETKNTLNSEIKRNSAFAWRIWSRSPGKEISNSWCVLLSHSIFGTFFLASGEKGDLNGDGIGSAALWFFRKRAQRGKSKPPAYPNLFLLWRSTEELPSMQKTFIGHSRQVNKPCGPTADLTSLRS